MITVGIFINGGLLLGRSATNEGVKNERGETQYVTDAGDVIWHHRDAGAVALAKKLLDSIKHEVSR